MNTQILACVLCQRRRVKCDRKLPCSTCIKSNVLCTPRKPAPAKQRRRPTQELKERLQRCEALLMSLQEQSPNGGSDADAGQLTTSKNKEADRSQHPGTLWVSDGRVRFAERQIWATMHDELQQMRLLIDSHDEVASCLRTSVPSCHDQDLYLHLTGEPACGDVGNLGPEPASVFRLWQLFLDRVNPLTKIIHVPSLQPHVVEASTGIGAVPVATQALLFAIYAMAVVSLSESDCMDLFRQPRERLWRQYMTGARMSLIQANFMHDYDMTLLQAFLLYLLSLEDRYSFDTIYILNGNCVRIAQNMGYHRDGEALGLQPFEIEMRRRIWWHILVQDAKLSTAAAAAPSIVSPSSDTKPPCNINDVDMHPSSSEPILPRAGPTEMAFVLLLNEVYKFKQPRDTAAGDSAFELTVLQGNARRDGDRPGDYTASHLGEMQAVARQFDTRLAELEKGYVDASAGTVHQAALCIRPLFASKWVEILDPPGSSEAADVDPSCPYASLYRYLIASVEYKLDACDSMSTCGFGWFMNIRSELDYIATMIAKTRYQPTGMLSERVWNVVERLYEKNPDLFDLSKKHYSLLANYVQQAWLVRVEAYTQRGWMIPAPEFMTRIQGFPGLDASMDIF